MDQNLKINTHNITFRNLNENDFEEVYSLWEKTPGVGLRDSDNKSDFIKFLKRNPGMSYSAVIDNKIVGTIMCGHDGRRGYIYHLAVDENFRRKGIATALVDLAILALKKENIEKCSLFVLSENEKGHAFWKNSNWYERTDLTIYQKDVK